MRLETRVRPADPEFRANVEHMARLVAELRAARARAAAGGDPAEAAQGAVRLALLPDDGPTGEFFSWDGTPVPW